MLLKTYEIPRPTNLYFSSHMVWMGCLNRLRKRACFQHFIVASNVVFYSSLNAAAEFEQCIPFVNPANISPDKLLVGDYKHLIWSGSRQNAIFTMLGAVTSCNIINSTTIGNNRYRAITIIPYAPSFAGFTSFLGEKYECSDMFGPFDFGCLLTFSSRREGLSSTCLSAFFSIECINDVFVTDGSAPRIQNTKRNMKAFGSCANAPPVALWFNKQFPPFVDFDQESECIHIIVVSLCSYLTVLSLVPIYDAHSSSFMFSKKDFVGIPSLPRFKKRGDPKHADLPPNALVTVFYSLNTYTSTRAPPTPSTLKMTAQSDNQALSGSSSRENNVTYTSDNNSKYGSSLVLSLNVQFLLYHGLIPDDE